MTVDPDHLVPDDHPLDVEQYHRAVRDSQLSAEEIVRSDRYPQPYTLGAESLQAWESDLMINAGVTVDEEEDRRGWEIRTKGTEKSDGRWIRSTCRVSNLELMS